MIFELLSYESLYGAAKQVISHRFGINAGKPRSPFLEVEYSDRLKKTIDKIEKYVSELGEY